MISDKDLQDAARTCEKAILDDMPEPEDCPEEFSPAFERRMRRVIRRVDHPVRYWLAQILPLLLIAGALAAVLLLPGGGGAGARGPAAAPDVRKAGGLPPDPDA